MHIQILFIHEPFLFYLIITNHVNSHKEKKSEFQFRVVGM